MKIKGLKISCEEFVNPKLFSINNTRIVAMSLWEKTLKEIKKDFYDEKTSGFEFCIKKDEEIKNGYTNRYGVEASTVLVKPSLIKDINSYIDYLEKENKTLKKENNNLKKFNESLGEELFKINKKINLMDDFAKNLAALADDFTKSVE